jgi:tetratricopeptide (TPR) repeat protein
MHTAARNSLALIDLFSLKQVAEMKTATSHAGFYQHVVSELTKGICTRQVFTDLGNKLIAIAEYAYAIRRMDIVEQASQFLLNLPLSREYQSVGRYYEASCLYRKGKFREARIMLECLAGELPSKFRARALIALSATYYQSGDFKFFLSLCLEAGRTAAYDDLHDPQSIVTAHRNLALYKSTQGDHHGAIADLERMFPLVRAVSGWQPYLYYEHLNSFAVELGEVGRLEEAHNVSEIVLASPLASAYPEWRETRDEIALRGYRASRSFVAFSQKVSKVENVLSMPVREHSGSIASEKLIPPFVHKRAGVTFIQDWKSNMVKKRNGDKKDNKPTEELDDREMLLKIVQISTQKGLPDEALLEMVDALEKIAAKYTKKDDDNDD